MNVERISEQLPLGIEIGSIKEKQRNACFNNHVVLFFLILYYEFNHICKYEKFIYQIHIFVESFFKFTLNSVPFLSPSQENSPCMFLLPYLYDFTSKDEYRTVSGLS